MSWLKEAVLRVNGFDEMSLLRVIALSHSLGSKDYMYSETMYINDYREQSIPLVEWTLKSSLLTCIPIQVRKVNMQGAH